MPQVGLAGAIGILAMSYGNVPPIAGTTVQRLGMANADQRKRWHVIISYKPEHMTDDVFDVEELEEIASVVEHGPDWNHIDAITITLNS